MSYWENYKREISEVNWKKVFQEEESDLLYRMLLMGQVSWELTMEVTMEDINVLGKNKLGGMVEAKVWQEGVQEQMVGEESELTSIDLAVQYGSY